MFGARFGRRGGGGGGPTPPPVVAADGTLSGIGAAGPVVVENVTTGAHAILTAGDGDNLFALARAAGIAAPGESVRLADTTAPSGEVALPPYVAPSVRAIIGQSEDSIALFLNSGFYVQGPYPTLDAGVDAQVAIRGTDDKTNAPAVRAITPATIAARDVNPGAVAFANLWHRGSGGVPLRLVGTTMPGTSMTDMMDDDPAVSPGRQFSDDAALVALAESTWGAPITDVSYVWWVAEASVAKNLWTNRSAHVFGINPDGTPYDFTAGPLDHCLIDTTGRGYGLISSAAKVHMALPGTKVAGLIDNAQAVIDPPFRSYQLDADGANINGMPFQNAMPAVQARKDFLAQAPAANRGAIGLTPALCKFGDYEGGVQRASGQTLIHPALYDADGQILFAQHVAAHELVAAGYLARATVDRWERSADGSSVTMIVRLPPGAALTTMRKVRGGAIPASPRPHQQLDGMGFTILRDANRVTSGTNFEDVNMRQARPLYRADATDAALYPTSHRGTVTIIDSGTDQAPGVREGRVRIAMVEPLTATERVYFCAEGTVGAWDIHGTPDYDARLYLDGLIAHVPALYQGSHPYPGIPVEPQAMAVVGNMTVAAAPADTTAPTLTGFIVGTVTATAAPLSVTSDEGSGSLHAVEVAAGALEPSAAQVQAGQDATGAPALVAGSVPVPAAGTQTITLTTAESGTARDRVAWLVQVDAAGNRSVPVSVAYTRPAAVDATPPVLSGATVGTVTTTDAPVTVTTSEAGGVLHAVEVAAGAPLPSAAQVVAGQDSDGAAALVVASAPVAAAGAIPVTLTTGTAASARDRVACLVHVDAAGNASGVASVAYTRPAAAPAATEFRFAGDWLRDPANVPAGTTRIEHIVRFRATTTYGATSTTIKLATQEALHADLGVVVTSTSATLHVIAKDGDATTLYSGPVAGATLPPVGTWVTAGLDWNLAAATLTASLDGTAFPLTLTGAIAPATLPSTREISFGATTGGANKVPADMEFQSVETWLTTNGVRTRRARFGPAEFEAEKAGPGPWFVDGTP